MNPIKNNKARHIYLGMAKTTHNSNICLLDEQMFLKRDPKLLFLERFSRVKNDGSWPLTIVNLLESSEQLSQMTNLCVGSTRDLEKSETYESFLNKSLPLEKILNKKNLTKLLAKNHSCQFEVGHHEAHAYTALFTSPFEKSLIVVFDGAGSNVSKDTFEMFSVYSQNGPKLKLEFQENQKFSQGHDGNVYSNGVSIFYEKVSEQIFDSKHCSGKLMGLAALGDKQEKLKMSYEQFLMDMNKHNTFTWNRSESHDRCIEVASIAQSEFESFFMQKLYSIKKSFPSYENIILTGGCALNCTFNMKLVRESLFKQVYVTPAPGDESTSLGVAFKFLLPTLKKWSPYEISEQKAYWNPKYFNPNVSEVFKNWKIKKSPTLLNDTAKLLADKNIIAWFQGHSESGPRALGNRSIIADIKFKNLKNHLNQFVKYRESFRPYACTIPHEDAHEYLDIKKGFHNPFMSFAMKVRPQYRDLLKEVSHVDSTSRAQLVTEKQNKKFHSLLKEFETFSGYPILLNTSLNIMGQPIVESLDDLREFLEKSPKVRFAVYEDYIIENKYFSY